MNNKINFVGMGHINIVVGNIDEGISFYKNLFGAVPYQIFRNFSNVGFSKAAGFLENPERVDLQIAFLEIPNTGLTLELMQYITPETVDKIMINEVTAIAGVRHVALKVNNIDEAFAYVSSLEGVSLINSSKEYHPYRIDPITKKEFAFFDEKLEKDEEQKMIVVKTIGNTKYFYFRDRYGVQWEFEQGHTDVGNDK